MKRYQGKWHKEKTILFPGYILLVSGDEEKLYHRLKKVTGLTIGTGREIVPLDEAEVRSLREFGIEEQIVSMSKGIIENDKVMATTGPMKGNEELIRKIDRHKRRAYLEIEMFGRKIETQVGLEIVARYKKS